MTTTMAPPIARIGSPRTIDAIIAPRAASERPPSPSSGGAAEVDVVVLTVLTVVVLTDVVIVVLTVVVLTVVVLTVVVLTVVEEELEQLNVST